MEVPCDMAKYQDHTHFLNLACEIEMFKGASFLLFYRGMQLT